MNREKMICGWLSAIGCRLSAVSSADIFGGWQVIEEDDIDVDPDKDIFREFVYGRYIDEPLVRDNRCCSTIAELNDSQGQARLFYHSNTQYSIHALTDEEGEIVEGYQYDAYGRQTVFTDAGGDGSLFTQDDELTVNGSSELHNPYMFQGRMFDVESGMYFYRNRYYNSRLGRFISRDPMGVWYDVYNFGNGYVAFGDNASNKLDQYGLFAACVGGGVGGKIFFLGPIFGGGGGVSAGCQACFGTSFCGICCSVNVSIIYPGIGIFGGVGGQYDVSIYPGHPTHGKPVSGSVSTGVGLGAAASPSQGITGSVTVNPSTGATHISAGYGVGGYIPLGYAGVVTKFRRTVCCSFGNKNSCLGLLKTSIKLFLSKVNKAFRSVVKSKKTIPNRVNAFKKKLKKQIEKENSKY